jgi:RNA polymerase sigma factor (sigma-70 family)
MRGTPSLSDYELICAFQHGDSAALETLVLRHKNRLFTSIKFLVKDEYLAEDILQETFIRIIDTLRSRRYAEEGKFLPWAMRIARNLCVDHFRKVKRTPTIQTGEHQDLFEVLPFTEESTEEKMMRSQLNDRVRHLLDLLPADQREVIILRHYADMTFKEIAGLTGCSINTALGRMRYGLINLRKMMTQRQISR